MLTLCLIAEVFRISFPSPPYSNQEQQMVLPMFVSSLQVLEEPGASSYVYGCTLLETLSTVSVFSLEGCTDTLSDLFKLFFTIVRPDHSTKIRQCMIQVMSSVVQEVSCVSQELLDLILINILEPAKSEMPSSYALAVDFIRAASTHLEPYIQLFFNNTLVTGKSSESEVADRIYDLILELHGIDPTLLLSVLSQLEYKLKSTDSDERLKVTLLLAKMFALKDSKLALENKTLWFCFLGRFSDVSSDVRTECVKHSKYYLAYHPDLSGDVSAKLHERFHDPEESVRLETVHAVCEAAAESLEAIPKLLMDDVQERMRDKKWAVRKETMTNLARLYRQVTSRSGVQVAEIKKIDWIASKIFHCYYQSSLPDKLCVERCTLSCLVPATLEVKERMSRLISMYSSLDEYATRAFGEMLKSQFQTASSLKSFITYQEEDVEENRDMFEGLKKALSYFVSEPSNAFEILDSIFKACKDQKLKDEFLKALSTDSLCPDVILAKANILKMVEEMKGVSEVIKVLLDHCCSILLDVESVQILVEKICEDMHIHNSDDCIADDDQVALQKLQLLKMVSSAAPTFFSKPETLQHIMGFLRSKNEQISKTFLQILTAIGGHVHTSASGCLHPVLTQLVLKGSPQLTKDATRCFIGVFGDSASMIERLFKNLAAQERLVFEHANLSNTLIAIGQIAKLQPTLFATYYKQVIRDFVVKELLVIDRSKALYNEGNPEWSEESSVSFETQAKVLGIKVLVLWLLGIDRNHKKLAVPVFRLLDTMLAHDGDLQGQDNISAPDRSRLRLSAANGILRLARNPVLVDIISVQQFQRLALVAQDTCKEVRARFMDKLHHALKSMELPMSYISVLSLVGTESDKRARAQHQQMLIQHIGVRRNYFKRNPSDHTHPEYILCEVVYLLAHHPCMESVDESSTQTVQECLSFIMEPLLRGGDAALAFLILESIKKTVDAQDPENKEICEKMHNICDMAINEISTKVDKKLQGVVTQRIALPVRLFSLSKKYSKLKFNNKATEDVSESENCQMISEGNDHELGGKRKKALKEKTKKKPKKHPIEIVSEL
eukprot:Em0022g717a